MFIPGEGTDSCQDCRCTRSVHCCYTSSDNLIEYTVIQLYNSIKLYWLFRHARGQQFKMKNKNLMSFEWELLPGDSWALGQGLNAGLAAGGCLSGAAGWRGGCRGTRGPLTGTSSADPRGHLWPDRAGSPRTGTCLPRAPSPCRATPSTPGVQSACCHVRV